MKDDALYEYFVGVLQHKIITWSETDYSTKKSVHLLEDFSRISPTIYS